MDRIDRSLDLISKALLGVSLLAGFVMVAHVTGNVFMRTVVGPSISGTDQVVANYYMIAATFLPFAYIAYRDQHISVEILTEHLKPGLRRWLDLFTLSLTIAYMALFTWQSWVSVFRQMDRQEVRDIPQGYLLVWPVRWLLVIAGATMLAVLVLRLVRDVRGLVKG